MCFLPRAVILLRSPPSILLSTLHASLPAGQATCWISIRCFIAKLFIKEAIVALKIDRTIKVLFTVQTAPGSIYPSTAAVWETHRLFVYELVISFTDQSRLSLSRAALTHASICEYALRT